MIEAIRNVSKTISSRCFLWTWINVYFQLDKVAASDEKSHKYFNLIWNFWNEFLNVLHYMSWCLSLLLIFSHWNVACNIFNNFVSANKSLFAFHWLEGAENERKRSCLSIKLINNKRYSEFAQRKVSLATHFKIKSVSKVTCCFWIRFLRHLNNCCFYFLCQLPFTMLSRSLTWIVRFGKKNITAKKKRVSKNKIRNSKKSSRTLSSNYFTQLIPNRLWNFPYNEILFFLDEEYFFYFVLRSAEKGETVRFECQNKKIIYKVLISFLQVPPPLWKKQMWTILCFLSNVFIFDAHL